MTDTTKDSMISTRPNLFKAHTIELVLFACAIFLKGNVIRWNEGLGAGYLSFEISMIVLAVGYIAMILCLSEMTSVTAFAGGCYGYTRCSINPFVGFLCGCCEMLAMHIFCALSVITFVVSINHIYPTPHSFDLFWAAILYFLLGLVFLGRDIQFWIAMISVATFALVVILMYSIGMMIDNQLLFSTSRLSERENGYFSDGTRGWINHMYYASWFFIGIECITVIGSKIKNPSKVLSRALPISVILAVIFAFWIYNIVYFSLPVGMLKSFENIPVTLSWGFVNTMKYNKTTSIILCLPPMVSSVIGLMYSIINNTNAMTHSGLLPVWFKYTIGKQQVPIVVVIINILFQYIILIIQHFMTKNNIDAILFRVGILAACVSYFGILSSFISFKTRFSGMDRLIRFPIWICFFGLAVFILEFIAVIVFDPQNKVANSIFFILIFVSSLYYCFVVRHTQFFSKEEQEKFFKVYILNANLNRNQKKGKKSTSSRKLTSLLTRWMHILRTNDTSTKPFQSMASNAFSVFNNGKVLPIEGNNEIVVIGAPSGKNSQVQLIDDIRRSSFVN